MMAPDGDEGVGSKDQTTEARSFWAQMPWPSIERPGPGVTGRVSFPSTAQGRDVGSPFPVLLRGERWDPLFPVLPREQPSLYRVSLHLPYTFLPLEPTDVSPLSFPAPQGPRMTPCLSLWWEAGGIPWGPPVRRPHLLMEIVVKHNQVEVSLQTPQRPLPNTVLAVASLKGEDQEGEWGGKNGAAGASQPPPQEGQELSLRNPQKTICASLHHTQFCHAGSSSKHLTLPHLQQITGSSGTAMVTTAGFTVLPLSPETGWGSPLCSNATHRAGQCTPLC